jgi:predicted membrane protein
MKTDKSRNVALAGLFLLIIGAILFVEKLGIVFPCWLFSWEMIVILVGLYIGIKKRCRGAGWLLMVGFGTFFLLDDMYPTLMIFNYLWPISIIFAGLLLILKSFRKDSEGTKKWKKCHSEETSSEDVLKSVTIFGGAKKVILSKNFQGGEIVSVMGGVELSLMQADIDGKVYIDISQVFSGVKVLVPSNWVVQSEIVSVMGAFHDSRKVDPSSLDQNKILVFKGTLLLGGIDVKSY